MDERPSAHAPLLPPPPRRRIPYVALGAAAALALAVGVAAMVIARSDATSVVPPAPSRTRSPEPSATLSAPTGLSSDVSAFEVTLTWSSVPGSTGYEVVRDGEILTTVTPPRFVDGSALPGQRYTYEIVATNDQASSDPAVLEVQTDGAPVSLARLEGLFDVQLSERSHFGLTLAEGGRRYTSAWRFEPRCERGPCAVRWVDRSTRGLAANLRRTGATYRGSTFGRFGGTCEGTTTKARVTVAIRVVEARVEGDAWRAATLRGTVSSRSSAQLGCVSAGIVYRFTARLV
jgi:hypothetical protein